ncbi:MULTISPECIES: DUF4129 domain-containing protein [unclassified Pseudomonas]|uniref:DUF4129 domain-containing protein n=1 Tax=unclassified Pseudomonas TaxID=196821 RepID=UPI002B233042|nr:MULTISPECIES: DUF4129 domain-containing protein [unclassified Pseudomonas]MEA9978971.1 DUF4129 domain-containing protein [Pseudomonas sp. RTS4]MEB0198476.1 DUF4129 domain-containing protein [Pseudomonas sp. 5S4]MEB0246183.1 DUF4129 domain-containing protein [Pseudomonas sp. 10S5]
MRLTDASVAIRPRNSWEAIDLGVLLARKHRLLLMSSWAIVTLPIFALLSLVFWDYPALAILSFWWLKPIFERLPLFIVSQALFGSTPSLEQALKGWLRLLKPQWFASLTWRRLSMSRSFKLPVLQLEGLSGLARQQRISVLSRRSLRAARWLTSIGSTLETTLWLGLMVVFYLLIPQQIRLDWSWGSLIGVEENWVWLEHLSNALYALVLVFWEPIYVVCGFTLYLNRRTELEAWDIELVLRRLRQRLIGSAYVLLIGVGLVFSAGAPSAWADEQSYSCPLPPSDDRAPNQTVAGPDSPRLTHQMLTSSAARDSIKAQLAQPPFKNPVTINGWRLIKAPSSAEKPVLPSQWLLRLINWAEQASRLFAHAVQVLLWTAAMVVVSVLLWRYRTWFRTLVPRQAVRPIQRVKAQQLFGLQVNADSLPDDVAAAAERLWPDQPREALGLLYRALLSRLLIDYHLPLKNADTEGEVLQQVAHLNLSRLNEFSLTLTAHWQNLAYGHQVPDVLLQHELCEGWRQLFGRRSGSEKRR